MNIFCHPNSAIVQFEEPLPSIEGETRGYAFIRFSEDFDAAHMHIWRWSHLPLWHWQPSHLWHYVPLKADRRRGVEAIFR